MARTHVGLNELEEAMRKATDVGFGSLAGIPAASGIYTAWLVGADTCFYVGKAARLIERIRSHYSGQRGSDQFCLYVYDRFMCVELETGLSTREINQRTAMWIRERVTFRWVIAPVEELAVLEAGMRKAWVPILNPLS
jgi:hypothetical protein